MLRLPALGGAPDFARDEFALKSLHRDFVATISALDRPSSGRFETPAILKALTLASRKLAEPKGVAASIPNQSILTDIAAAKAAGCEPGDWRRWIHGNS